MRFLRVKRPLFWFAMTAFALLCVLLATDSGFGWCAAALGFIALLFSVCVPSLRKTALRVFACGVLFASLLAFVYDRAVVLPLAQLENITQQAVVRIVKAPQGNSKMYTAQVVGGDALPRGTRIGVSFAPTVALPEKYDEVDGALSLYLPSAENAHWHSDGVHLLGYYETAPTVTAGQSRWHERLADSVRERLLHGIRSVLTADEGDFLAGVCLGDVTTLSDTVTRDFRKSGLSHLLVVSGLHMTVVAGAVYQLTRLCRMHRRWSLILTLACVWFFTLIVGFTCSVVRAAVMLHILLIGRTLRVRADARTSLATALVCIVLQNPYAVQDVGFLLSFAATFGLVVLSPLAVDLCDSCAYIAARRWLRKVILAFATPLAAMAFTLPLTAYVFGSFSVLSPLANVLAVYPTTIALCCGLVGGIIGILPFGLPLAKGVLLVAGLMAKWVLAVAHAIAAVSPAQLQIRHTVFIVLCIVIPIAIYFGYTLYGKSGGKRIAASGLALVLVCVVGVGVFSNRTVTVRVADAGNDLVTLVQTPDCCMAIVSGGSHDAFLSAKRYIAACGVERLDVLVVTEGDETVTASLAAFTQEIAVDALVYTVADTDYTAGIAGVTRYPVTKPSAFSFGARRTLETKDGWWHLTLGETTVLFAMADAGVSGLPYAWRTTDAVVFCGDVPKGVNVLETQRAVLLCTPYTIRYHTTDLPWGRYPIHIAANDGEAVWCTRESGGFADAGRFYL